MLSAGQINSVGAQEIRLPKAGNLKAVENWILYIKLGNDEVCAGVQLSDNWVLTLADCIDEKFKLTKYSIVYKDGSRKVIAEDRDSVGKLFILLKMKKEKEPRKTKFTQLADSKLPSSEYKFHLYNRDDSDKIIANEVDFVRGAQCEKEEIDGNFRETHKCVQGNMNEKARCLPGSPVFGSKKKEIILQGLAVTSSASSDPCLSQLQSIAVTKPQVNWINSVIIDCGPIKTFRNGKVKLNKKSSTTIGSTATIRCNPGYEANQKKIVCLENGKWEKPSCELKDCGVVKNIQNGKITLDDASSSTMGATATVECDPGYKASREIIKCLKTGKWRKSSCKIKDCGSQLNVTNGNLHFNTTTFGSIASLVCDRGYDGNGTIRCLDNGSWATPPICSLKDCGSPLNVTNGKLHFNTTRFGSIASLVCDRGYDGNGTIRCLDTGSWETPPICSIKDCGSPLNVTNGKVHYSATTFGSTVSLVCDSGYDGNGTISCLDTGSWETPPICSIKDCGSPFNVTNGKLHYNATTFGSTASLVCDSGYDGNGTISCLDTGSWETPPICSIKVLDCPGGWSRFENSCYLRVESRSTWETAKTDCESKKGYLVEITSRSEYNFLLADLIVEGIWLGVNDIKSEGTFLWEYSGASFDKSILANNIFRNSPERDCVIYYYQSVWMLGNCELENEYLCEMSLHCGSPLNVTNGKLYYNTTTFGSTASLVCDSGYDGNGTISCLDTGSWETPPRCSIKDCGSPFNVTNGKLHYNSTTFGSTVSLVCDSGYDGNGTISCLDTGSWETPPICSFKVPECPGGWSRFENSCYLHVESMATWETAKNDCESKKGYLVEITSSSEYSFLLADLMVEGIWLGVSDIKSEGTFLWEYSGASFDKSILANNIYLNSPERDCGIYYYLEVWVLGNCELKYEYLCEMSL
ncbi:sushi, von Willebrand factor type A, EGF and pentraxin domain-containing protein 1-like [Ruditapes philippinarum]|uniref:sushi, von Willebrand factor type A, EGF and pentraxin domain-containing protein 1-like n=1 Tax=Ruditapes philippinarum TaxID=129788 RepID=UPI00295BD045|nr:sushi, von Willebrand factor type A, EGF and pentraxin domain-containing protein 1-like [Ruditapes philippinarum]